MHAEISGEGETVVIHLRGRFTFEAHIAFAAAIEKALLRDPQEIQLDLSDVEYINSAGLGMLLLLQKKARNSGKSISLASCPGTGREAVEIACLQNLFGAAWGKPTPLAAH